MEDFVLATPLPCPERRHSDAEVSEGAQEEEDGHVGRRVVDGRRRVGDSDAAGGARLDVHLIVARAVVADEPEGCREHSEQLFIDPPRHVNAVKGAVGRDAALESPRSCLLQEVGPVG